MSSETTRESFVDVMSARGLYGHLYITDRGLSGLVDEKIRNASTVKRRNYEEALRDFLVKAVTSSKTNYFPNHQRERQLLRSKEYRGAATDFDEESLRRLDAFFNDEEAMLSRVLELRNTPNYNPRVKLYDGVKEWWLRARNINFSRSVVLVYFPGSVMLDDLYELKDRKNDYVVDFSGDPLHPKSINAPTLANILKKHFPQSWLVQVNPRYHPFVQSVRNIRVRSLKEVLNSGGLRLKKGVRSAKELYARYESNPLESLPASLRGFYAGHRIGKYFFKPGEAFRRRVQNLSVSESRGFLNQSALNAFNANTLDDLLNNKEVISAWVRKFSAWAELAKLFMQSQLELVFRRAEPRVTLVIGKRGEYEMIKNSLPRRHKWVLEEYYHQALSPGVQDWLGRMGVMAPPLVKRLDKVLETCLKLERRGEEWW